MLEKGVFYYSPGKCVFVSARDRFTFYDSDAKREGLARGRTEEREKWQSVVADCKAEITGKDAEIARLRAELETVRDKK